MEKYLTTQVQTILIQENRQYESMYKERSLDQPVGEAEDDFSLYDLLTDDDSGGIARAEDRIMREQFRAQLSQKGQDLLLMLESGCTVEQVEQCLHMDKPDVYRLAADLRKQWREFSGEIYNQ